ncbi:MAG: serine/threonine protein kinase [Polyangiales bacterium]
MTEASPHDDLIGIRIFGGYHITQLMGNGGMGAVFLAENQSLGTKLAVKVLHPSMCGDTQVTCRFIDEAKAASAIRHRNIIQVIDASEMPDGRPYIVLEWLEGETLREHARSKGRMTLTEAAPILLQICSGLQAAHARKIIHRDLKPANLFITYKEDGELRVTILDFGVAKLSEADLLRSAETQTNTVIGTPNYMAPEQARACADVDVRADIYALGVVAFELLTQQRLYSAHCVGDLIFQMATAPMPRLRDVLEDVDPAVDAWLSRAVALERDERFADVPAFAAALIHAIPDGQKLAQKYAPEFATLPVSTSLPATAHRNTGTTRRGRLLGVAALASALIGGVAWFVWPRATTAPNAHGQQGAITPSDTQRSMPERRRAPDVASLGQATQGQAAATTQPQPQEGAQRNATLTIRTKPPGAVLCVDGTRLDERSPTRFPSELGRKHRIVAEYKGKRAIAPHVAIDMQQSHVELNLQRTARAAR